MDPEPQTYLIIVITLLCSAFFSGMEIAFVSANRLKIELDKNSGATSGKILAYFVKNTSNFISAMLLGNNVSLVVYGIFMAVALEPVLSFASEFPAALLFLQTILSTLLVLVTAEFLPKAIFRINPNGILSIGAIPLFIVYWVFYIPTLIVMSFSNLILKLMKTDIKNVQQVFTKVDLDHYVRDLNDRIAEDAHLENEIQILNNALEFSNVKARDCMVPRTDIVACNLEDDIHSLKEKFISSGLSKILIYRDTIDNIIGYVHAYELFNKPDQIKNVMLPVGVVPEAIYAKELLSQFTRTKRSIVVVVDEYGGTSGLITVEDIIEEIFGEIEDEHDHDEELKEQIDETTFIFSGRTEIDHIIQEHNLPIPQGEEYETLAGFVLNELEEIPEAQTSFDTEKLTFTILEVSDSKIDLIKVEIKE
ncbi:hemolysin family protein [Crocinitomix catalasitica]|uniref:hemolysin family protein n=1 Tax=Crocinitomix catalasitica TaxID=184607 RepID=UPI00048480D3|nr:hemolysin family protein [Crocinitomix catalasitica]